MTVVSVLHLLALICLGHLTNHANGEVTLMHQDTVYLPYQYDPDQFGYNMGGVEKGALDKNNNFLYGVGLNLIHVINYDIPDSLTTPHHVVLPGSVEATDVTTCGTWVGVSAVNLANPRLGKVFVYSTYTAGGSMNLLHDITVGTRPDMLIFTADCSQILVAIEGSVANDINGVPYDAEGEVAFIIFSPDPSGTYSIQRADFTAFNSQSDFYTSQGIRWIYHGENAPFTNTFSQDLEPEYITFNDDESIAYVVLQENNAVATINMATRTITEIYPLGEKAWSNSLLDPSDRDSGINLAGWEVFGSHQPDGFKFKSYNGVGYLITANEGDAREIGAPIDWTETQRGKDFSDNGQIDESVSIGLAQSLSNNEELGRLDLSLVDYKVEGQDKYYKFLSYGGRSFSLFRVEADGGVGGIHYDSGSEFEQRIAILYGDVFNGNFNTETDIPEDTLDGRSDNSGPEPESIETGSVNGKELIFIGLERPGFIAVYSVDVASATPQYESLHYYGGTGDTWENMYNARTCRDLDPEGLRFIPANRSPTGTPMLSVFSPVTSTVSLYNVVDIVTEVKELAPENGEAKELAPENGEAKELAPENGEGVENGASTGVLVGVGCAVAVIIIAVVAGTAVYIKRKAPKNKTTNRTESTMNLPDSELEKV